MLTLAVRWRWLLCPCVSPAWHHQLQAAPATAACSALAAAWSDGEAAQTGALGVGLGVTSQPGCGQGIVWPWWTAGAAAMLSSPTAHPFSAEPRSREGAAGASVGSSGS